MRIAVLVHNDVVKDARVRKEVRTLVDAGHSVDVFGLRNASSLNDYPLTVEGAQRLEVLPYRMFSPRDLLRGRARIMIAILGVAFAAGLMGVLAFGHPEQIVSLIALLALVPLGVLNRARGASRAWMRYSAGGYLLVYLLALGGLAWTGSAPLVVLLAGAAAASAVYGLKLTPQKVKRLGASLLETVFRAFRAGYRRRNYENMARILADRVMASEYDVLHCHDLVALIAGGRIKRAQPSIKLVWDAHEIYDSLANASAADNALSRAIIEANQKLVDGFITISHSFVSYYARHYQLPPATLVMNAARKIPRPHDDGRLRAAAGLNADRKILLFQGGFCHKRGLSMLMEAAERLPQPWSIVAMGWGILETDLKRTACRLAESRAPGEQPLAVIPAAPQDELPLWTAGATLGVIPYENSGTNHLYCTPNKLWEYPAAGVPILATNLVELGRMINKWKIGFLLPRDATADDIVSFLATVRDDSLAELRTNCAHYSEQMSWARFEADLIRLYRDINVPRAPLLKAS